MNVLPDDPLRHCLGSLQANPGMDWEYFAFHPPLIIRMVDAGDGTYELIVLVSRPCLETPI